MYRPAIGCYVRGCVNRGIVFAGQQPQRNLMPHHPGIALAWQRDPPDFRDFTPEHPEVASLLVPLNRAKTLKEVTAVDLTEYFAEALDRGPLAFCTAHVAALLVEYFERRANGQTLSGSGLFLYKMACKLAGPWGQTGCNARTTLKALVRFGLPPERYWPSDEEHFHQEPDPFLCSFAAPFRALRYVRLDTRNSTGANTLMTVRAFLAAGFPCLFGLPVPSSLSRDEEILYRPLYDSVFGAQALLAVGYDDQRLTTTRGALRVRSCGGVAWPERRYAWLPYRFIEEQLAVDFWTVLRPDWLESGEFDRPMLPHIVDQPDPPL